MFCMNCGQQLPEGAKFCLNCGTPQGAVSPTETPQSETINARTEAKQNDPKVGDEISFGNNNGQSIWWKVLSVREHMALIISNNNIASKPYHQSGGDITWADCTLRKWLNNEFIVDHFTLAERARILPCNLNNNHNSWYGTPGGVPTADKVFLLSINEAKQLFANDQARANGLWWWLRSPGRDSVRAAYVYDGGEVYSSGSNVNFHNGVRPALWLNLDS